MYPETEHPLPASSSKQTSSLLTAAAQPAACRPQISGTQLDLFQHIHCVIVASFDIYDPLSYTEQIFDLVT